MYEIDIWKNLIYSCYLIVHCLHRNSAYEFLFAYLRHKDKKRTFREVNFFYISLPVIIKSDFQSINSFDRFWKKNDSYQNRIHCQFHMLCTEEARRVDVKQFIRQQTILL